MPPLDDNLEADPSTAADLDDKDTSVQDMPDPAASSPATGETDDELLSVARDAIAKERQTGDAASPADGENTDQDPDEEDDGPKKEDDENYSDVPFNKHPRFQHLLRKAKSNEQDAIRYRNVETFLRDNDLNDQEAANALKLAGLAKHSPVQAWEAIKPWVTDLLVAAGEILPDDLKQRVANGELTPDAAIEVSRARAAKNSVVTAREADTRRAQNSETAALATRIRTAAQSWEDNRTRKDPNFADKKQALLEKVVYLQSTEGVPNTEQGVRDQLNKAYKAVNESFRPAQQPERRPEKRPVTGGQVAGNQRPANQSMSTLDIIRQNRSA